jgi:hypothetical protein
MSRLRLVILLSLVCLGTAWFAGAQVITSPQVSHFYNTFTNAENYERFAIDWTSTANVLRLATEAAGTGTVRNIALMGGNVGIGTAEPGYKLQVNGDLRAEASFSTYTGDGLFGSTAKPIVIGLPNGSQLRIGYATIGDGRYYGRIGVVNETGTITSDFGADGAFDSFTVRMNGSEKFRITNSGDVGIGMPTPNHLIDANLGMLTAQKAGLNITGTWNNAAVQFAALTMNITDSASAAGALLADLRVGGSGKFRLHKDGWLVQAKALSTIAAPGAGYGLLRWEAGTNAGTLKLVAYSGTSTTGTVIVDNVGGGN